MQISFTNVVRTFEKDPQIKLKIINILFALTIASYFVLSHATPKVFRWNLGYKLYEMRSEETSLNATFP